MKVPSCLFPCIFRLRRLCVSGLPRTPHPLATPSDESPGCPVSSSFGCAGDGFSSYLESHILPRCGFSILRVTPFPQALAAPLIQASGSPHCPASPALPAMDLRVAPNLASFGGADWPIFGLPRFPVFRYRRDPFLRLPRIADLPAPADGSPSHLGSRTIRLCHRRISKSP